MTNYDLEKRLLLERELLGAIMTYKGLNDRKENIKTWVTKTHGIDSKYYFCSEMNQAIFSAILKCWEAGVDCDPLTVLIYRPDKYKDRKDFENYKGFDIEVITASHTYFSMVHFDHKLFILKQYILMDYWNNKSADILNSNWDVRDVLIAGNNVIEEYKQLFDKFTVEYKKGDANLSVKERAKKEYQDVKSGIINWIPTGMPDYDRKRKGWRKGELTIIAARPSMGKSALMVACAWYAAKHHQKKVIIFSLEVDRKQIMNHIIAAESGLKYEDIKNHNLSEENFAIVLEWYDWFENHSTLIIHDINSARTMQDIYDITKEIQPDGIFVDYLQLVKLEVKINKGNFNREQDVAEISRNLKLTAVEFNIPVIAGAQLSRSVDSRQTHRAILSDLRESGSIEQDADNVLFPYRQAYYDEALNPNIEIPLWRKGNYEVHQAKGRDSGTGHFLFNLELVTYKFHDGFLESEPPMTIEYK